MFKYAYEMKNALHNLPLRAGGQHQGRGQHKSLLRRGLAAIGAALVCLTAPAQQVIPDTIEQRVIACTACHGKEGRATNDGYYPRIAGKPAGYLYNQLINFREGRRQYPMMTYMVDHLFDAYLLEMANYYADLHLPYPPPQKVDVAPSVIERGRTLAFSGDPARGIPSCASCHGKALTGLAPTIPGLLGLPRDYLISQFGSWRNGTRRAAAPDCMAEIANKLSIEEISAVSAWLASQPVPADVSRLPKVTGPLPMPCGSVPHQ